MISYYPYFRGKQYELICLRENARLIATAGFTPILEPVRDDLAGLRRCLVSLLDAGVKLLVVENPGCGALQSGLPLPIRAYVDELIAADSPIAWIHRFQSGGHLEQYIARTEGGVVLHDAPSSAAEFTEAQLAAGWTVGRNIFLDGRDSGPLYRRAFRGQERVLIRDGFRKKKNSGYLETPIEHFSDLYLTYEDEGMGGFGDFLTVGDDYSDGGGPAYAVAIHLTFVDNEKLGSLFLHHFVSDTNDTPADPAGKFQEALDKLAAEVRRPATQIARTSAVEEFLALHDRSHYPGLGYVKKLSMQHHLEVMSQLAGL